MTGTIFIILLLIAGLVIFALYKYIIPSPEGTHKTIEDYEYENKLQQESAYSYHTGDIDKTILLTSRAIEKNPNDVVSKFILGKLYLEKKQYKRALELFEGLKKLNKNHLPTREKLAECYIGINNLVKAENELNFIMKVKPDDINILHTLAFIYEKHKDTTATLNVLKLIINQEPNNMKIRKKLAHLCEAKGEFTRAIQEYEILYSHNPNDDYLYKLVDLYFNAERPQEALDLLEQMLVDNENDPKIIKKLAFLYWNLEQYEMALEYFEKIRPITLEEEDLITDYISQIYMYLGEYDKIIEICEKFLEKNPSSETIRLNLSKAFLAKREFQTAIDIIKDLLAETTASAKEKQLQEYVSDLFGKWAVYFLEHENYQEAFEKLMTALQYNDKNSNVYYNLAKTNSKIKNYEEALSQFKHAIYLSPNQPRYHLDKGLLYKEVGNLKNATSAIEKAVELNPNDSIAYFELGLIYMMQDIYDKSVILFKKSLDIDPSSVEIRFNLAIAYGKIGEKDMAIKEYEKILEKYPDHIDAKNNLNHLIEFE